MSLSDIVAGLVCLALPVALMLAALAMFSLAWRQFGSMLRRWVDRK